MDLKQLFDNKVSYVYGPSGAGKTILVSKAAFEFAKEGAKVVWITFNEGRDSLYETWQSFGWNPRDVAVFDFPYIPQYRETLFNQVVDLAYKEKADIFIVDGVDAVVIDRATADAFAKMGLRSIIGIETRYNPLADIADVIIKLRAVNTDYATIRRVEIQKARGVSIKKPVWYMAILPNGPVLLSNERSYPLESSRVPAPGLLAQLLSDVPLGAQIAVYGHSQWITAAVVDTLNAVAYVHKSYQMQFFKKAKTRLVSIYEHRRLEHYAERVISRYIITLDAEYVPRRYRDFRSTSAVWVDLYTAPPNQLEYDYVIYVDDNVARVEFSRTPLERKELQLP